MTPAELLDCVEHNTGARPTHSVIWLHGLGADGHDFAPIVPELRLPTSLSIRFVFPHASIQPVTLNGGMAMRAWYDILTPNLVKREDERGIRASEHAIHALIDRENSRGIPTERIVLAGFSQGCAMILHTGIRLPSKLAGLMGLSGYLPLIDLADNERHVANTETPIFIAHGTQDPVVALERAQVSREKLVALGYNVQWHPYPMQHSVCAQEIQDMSRFLQSVLI